MTRDQLQICEIIESEGVIGLNLKLAAKRFEGVARIVVCHEHEAEVIEGGAGKRVQARCGGQRLGSFGESAQ